MVNLVNHGTGRVRAQFQVPSRGLIGYRSEFLTDTRGTGILNSILHGFEPHRGPLPTRLTGSLVADRSGKAITYALFNLEPRGRLFVVPGDEVYEGMLIGEHNREGDLNVNPCKEKKLTNVRASGKDESTTLTPVLPLTLEQAIEFLAEDEVVEVTPKNIRLRKAILNQSERAIAAKRTKK
jgi:GTP-binding protein